jgi:hypothetical protein
MPGQSGCPFQPCRVVSRAHCGISLGRRFSNGTRVPRDRRARLTGSLHFPHRQLILAIASEAKALPGHRGLSSKGDSYLALSLRGVRI